MELIYAFFTSYFGDVFHTNRGLLQRWCQGIVYVKWGGKEREGEERARSSLFVIGLFVVILVIVVVLFFFLAFEQQVVAVAPLFEVAIEIALGQACLLCLSLRILWL